MIPSRTRGRLTTGLTLVLLAAGATGVEAAPQESGSRADAGLATATDRQGVKVRGRLVGDSTGGFWFASDGPGEMASEQPLEQLDRIDWEAREAETARGVPPLFTLLIGAQDRISGRLESVTENEVRLVGIGPAGDAVVVARPAVRAIVQAPGDSLVLAEEFDSLDRERWAVEGAEAQVGKDRSPTVPGSSLAIPAGKTSVTLRKLEPMASGRVMVAYEGSRRDAPGHRAMVELSFRGPAGPEQLQVELGWSSRLLAVRTQGGDSTLAVQRLERQDGLHRLEVEFSGERTSVALDRQELAYGYGPGGSLEAIRLATESSPEAAAAPDLSLIVDEVVVTRHTDPPRSLERDVAQDEARLSNGDQLFGQVREADVETVRFEILNETVDLPWAEVTGLYLRRNPKPMPAMGGLWVRLGWEVPGRDAPDQTEGVLEAIGPEQLDVRTAYAGPIAIATSRIRWMEILGRNRRLVIDSSPYHLGNAVIATLEPPHPDGGTLEFRFETPEPPPPRMDLVIDVVQAIGVDGDPNFSPRVRKGELLTHIALDGRRFDQINRHIREPNEKPLRLRIPLPAGAVRPGEHTIRFEQVGTREDPSRLDNLGLLSVAIETPISAVETDRSPKPAVAP